MKFDDLDKKMRIFETAADLCVLPSMFMVARLDGRSFTRLTKDVCQFEAPFDMQFRELMVATAQSLMTCGFRVLYAYTESDEISLLFDLNEQLFGRKLRKYNSTLAGEASAQFSLKLGRPACFDCRISQLPTLELVVDYPAAAKTTGWHCIGADCRSFRSMKFGENWESSRRTIKGGSLNWHKSDAESFSGRESHLPSMPLTRCDRREVAGSTCSPTTTLASRSCISNRLSRTCSVRTRLGARPSLTR